MWKAQIWPRGMKMPHFGAEFLWSSCKKHYRSLSYENLCMCLWLAVEKGNGKWFQISAQEQNSSMGGVTCSSCCCSCCNSPGLSGTPSRWRRRKKSVCQHPPTPGDREQGELQKSSQEKSPSWEILPADLHGQLCRLRGSGKAFTNHNLKKAKCAERELLLPIPAGLYRLSLK